MKRMIVLTLFLGGLVASISASPCLLESRQKEYVIVHKGSTDTSLVTEITFSVDTSCYLQMTAGGVIRQAQTFFKLDGKRLPPEAGITDPVMYTNPFCLSYTCALPAGEHTLSLCVNGWFLLDTEILIGLCDRSYLQAFLIIPDKSETPPVVNEQPDVEPAGGISSVISQGPYVSAPGASELVDASGRVIEDAIADGKVRISTLSPGTYFAREGERTVVKIVKVD